MIASTVSMNPWWAVLSAPLLTGVSVRVRFGASVTRVPLASFGKMPTTSARRFTSLFSRSNGLVQWSLVRCCGRKGHVGEHVMLGCRPSGLASFGPAGPQLIGDMPPDVTRRHAVGLEEGLADRGGDHGVQQHQLSQARTYKPLFSWPKNISVGLGNPSTGGKRPGNLPTQTHG